MKIEDHFKETLNRAVANEPPVLDAWDRFERRAGRGRQVRLFAAIAAAAAVAVASVIVVPQLGTNDGIGLSTNPPSQNPTVDPYAGWSTYDYDLYQFTLRHPTDWRVVVFEANPEVLAPGQVATAAGEPTMAVTLALLNEAFDAPRLRQQGFDVSIGPAGRPFVRTEESDENGGKRVFYRIDWYYCQQQTPAPGESAIPNVCYRENQTLAVTIHAGTDRLWEQYGAVAERIVTSIEQDGPYPS